MTKPTVGDCLEQLRTVERDLAVPSLLNLTEPVLFHRLACYFGPYQSMAFGYVKDPDLRAAQMQMIAGCQESTEWLDRLVNNAEVRQLN